MVITHPESKQKSHPTNSLDQEITFEKSVQSHPLLDFGYSQQENQKIWHRLPRLRGAHTLVPKPGAQILAKIQETGDSLWVWSQKGKGRVLAMGTLSLWQWALEDSSQSQSLMTYTKFWRNAIRVLVQEEEGPGIRIVLDKPYLYKGQNNRIRLLLDPDRFPSRGLEVMATLVQENRVLEEFSPYWRSRNVCQWDWEFQDVSGEVEIQAQVKYSNRVWKTQKRVQIKSSDMEYENPYPDPSFMQQCAAVTSGEYYQNQDFDVDTFTAQFRSKTRSQTQKKTVEIGSQSVMLVLASGFFFSRMGRR